MLNEAVLDLGYRHMLKTTYLSVDLSKVTVAVSKSRVSDVGAAVEAESGPSHETVRSDRDHMTHLSTYFRQKPDHCGSFSFTGDSFW